MSEHGTKARYNRGCRCGACSGANRESQAQRARLTAYGRWQPYVDATPAREHLRMLMGAGIGWKRAAVLAGISYGTVTNILYGASGRPPAARVRPETEQAILSVKAGLDALDDLAVTDATGTRRRVQALAAVGWPQAALAARLGTTKGNLSATVNGTRVRAGTARAVRGLYEELWDAPPPQGTRWERTASTSARHRAERQGWAPPLAWNDDIDDPAASPAEGWKRGPERRRRPAALIAAEAEELFGMGLGRTAAAERIGISRAALDKALSRVVAQEEPAA